MVEGGAAHQGGRERKAVDELDTNQSETKLKLGLWLMAFRFGVLHCNHSLTLWTEGLGRQPFHARVVLLVDEFTRSAAEIIAAFAAKSKITILVGTRPP